MVLFKNYKALINAPYETMRRLLYAELCRATSKERRYHDPLFVNNLLGHLECSSESGPLYFVGNLNAYKVEIKEENLIPYIGVLNSKMAISILQ